VTDFSSVIVAEHSLQEVSQKKVTLRNTLSSVYRMDQMSSDWCCGKIHQTSITNHTI